MKKVSITAFILLILFLVLFSAFRVFSTNNFSKDLFVAEFRTDVNKLWEVSKILESRRINNLELKSHEFGTTGEILISKEINQDMKKAIINIADINGDSQISEYELQSLGIMRLNRDIYSKELQTYQFSDLSIDNYLEHYVVITRGQYAGTVLYNGTLKIIDSSKRRYFGVELFQRV